MSEAGLLRAPARPKVTLAAVARRAGVSLATASKVLNGRDGVGSDTRQRVEIILAEVGYIAPGATRVDTEIPLIGASLTVLVDSVVDPYTAGVLAGVLEEADALGTSVVIRRCTSWRGRTSPTGPKH